MPVELNEVSDESDNWVLAFQRQEKQDVLGW